MDINKKFMFVFLLLCVIGMIILYNLTAIPDYGIRKQDFKLDDIQKIVVTKYPEEKEITLTDSAQIVPIIEAILKAKEIRISQPKANLDLYFIEIYKKSEKPIIKISIQKSENQGIWFGYLSTKYKSDSLYTILKESISF